MARGHVLRVCNEGVFLAEAFPSRCRLPLEPKACSAPRHHGGPTSAYPCCEVSTPASSMKRTTPCRASETHRSSQAAAPSGAVMSEDHTTWPNLPLISDCLQSCLIRPGKLTHAVCHRRRLQWYRPTRVPAHLTLCPMLGPGTQSSCFITDRIAPECDGQGRYFRAWIQRRQRSRKRGERPRLPWSPRSMGKLA